MQIPSLSNVVASEVLLFPSQWYIAHQSRGGTWPVIQSVFRLSLEKWRDYVKVICIKEFGLGFISAPAIESYYRWCRKMKSQLLFGYTMIVP